MGVLGDGGSLKFLHPKAQRFWILLFHMFNCNFGM